jgi:fucose permease
VPSASNPHPDATAGPSSLWLGYGFLLSGLGTVLLGPILPQISHDWGLSDQQSGLLLAAKFVGSFLGGVLVPARLRLGFLRGMLLACLGFAVFALSASLLPGALALLVAGFGLGQTIASTNILIGRRYSAHTGSAVALFNFFWSLGAVACGLLAAWLFPRFQLRDPLLLFAGLLLLAGLGGQLFPAPSFAHAPLPLAPSGPPAAAALPSGIFLHFALLLFLYGGLETCLTAWLTTYALRATTVHLLGGQSAVVLLWAALTAGRALSSAVLRVLPERLVQRAGLALSAVLIAALVATHSSALLSLDCVLLGLGLAPFFPSTFAILMLRQPSSRNAGLILAVSGLGAALFPWLMGVVSTHTGSLRVAMAVPFALAVALLLLVTLPGLTNTRPATTPGPVVSTV